MTVLSDNELKTLLAGPSPLISDFPSKWDATRTPLDSAEWDGFGSPIQPSSIDLHIGKIYVPGVPAGGLGSRECAHHSFALESGMSVVVLSHELLHLPDDICAIALPPSRISSAGVLIANFGHIDPGYRGHLRFTLINMGKETFNLERGAPIMTLLLLKMQPVGASYAVRTLPPSDDRPTGAQINRLAPDFANMNERATNIARGEIDRAVWLKVFLPVFSAVVVGSIVVSLTIGLAVRSWQASDLTEFQNERKAESKALDQQIRQLQLDLERIKRGDWPK